MNINKFIFIIKIITLGLSLVMVGCGSTSKSVTDSDASGGILSIDMTDTQKQALLETIGESINQTKNQSKTTSNEPSLNTVDQHSQSIIVSTLSTIWIGTEKALDPVQKAAFDKNKQLYETVEFTGYNTGNTVVKMVSTTYTYSYSENDSTYTDMYEETAYSINSLPAYSLHLLQKREQTDQEEIITYLKGTGIAHYASGVEIEVTALFGETHIDLTTLTINNHLTYEFTYREDINNDSIRDTFHGSFTQIGDNQAAITADVFDENDQTIGTVTITHLGEISVEFGN